MYNASNDTSSKYSAWHIKMPMLLFVLKINRTQDGLIEKKELKGKTDLDLALIIYKPY